MSANQTFDEIIDLNTQAAETLTAPDRALDDYAADLLLRNMAVAADRLTPGQFQGLGTDTIDAVLDAAAIARKLAPLDEADLKRRVSETDAEHKYRIAVWQPLHSLQSRVAIGGFEAASETEKERLKTAIRLGSAAFAAVVNNADDYPKIANTRQYFWGNTAAASRRLQEEL